MEDRIAELEPSLAGTVRALLTLVVDPENRRHLLEYDRKAYEQAWTALEQAVPGILKEFRLRRLVEEGHDNMTVDDCGDIWGVDDGNVFHAGTFEKNVPETDMFRSHPV